jgi:hypothetical protein
MLTRMDFGAWSFVATAVTARHKGLLLIEVEDVDDLAARVTSRGVIPFQDVRD